MAYLTPAQSPLNPSAAPLAVPLVSTPGAQPPTAPGTVVVLPPQSSNLGPAAQAAATAAPSAMFPGAIPLQNQKPLPTPKPVPWLDQQLITGLPNKFMLLAGGALALWAAASVSRKAAR